MANERAVDDSFKGRRTVAIITGASRGLGRAIGIELAKRRVAVALTSRSRSDCEAVAREIEGAGGTANAYGCDVSKAAEVRAMVGEVLTDFGRVDILVNNAGMIEPIAMVGQCDDDLWRENLEVNVCGPFYTAQAVMPHFLRNGGGVIVNISSGAAHSPKEGWSAYCAGKAALAMLTRSIALEAGDSGVLCYGFRPGVVDTEMQATIRESGINEISRLPREQLAPPDFPARLVALLCLGKPREANGRDLSIRDAEDVAHIEAAAGNLDAHV